MPAVIRAATPADYDAIRRITLDAYVVAGYVTPGPGSYAERLADVEGRATDTQLLVATDGPDGRVLGAVALATTGGAYAELAAPDEAVFRMLAVDPGARGRGVGTALVRACLDRSRAAGCVRIVISTQPDMTDAQRLYERLGFTRAPKRDWSPAPGVDLLVYERELARHEGEAGAGAGGGVTPYCPRCGEPADSGEHAGCAAALALEPPRYCPDCRRRMVVQVTPQGWTARCSEHGLRTS